MTNKGSIECVYPKCTYDNKTKSCVTPNPFTVALLYYANLHLSKKTVSDLYQLNKSKFTNLKSACRLLKSLSKKKEGATCSSRELGVLKLAEKLKLGNRNKHLMAGEIVYAIDYARRLFSSYTFKIQLIPFCLTSTILSYQNDTLHVCLTKIQEMYKDISASKHLFLAYIAIVSLIFYVQHKGDTLEDSTYNISSDGTACLSKAFTYLKRSLLNQNLSSTIQTNENHSSNSTSSSSSKSSSGSSSSKSGSSSISSSSSSSNSSSDTEIMDYSQSQPDNQSSHSTIENVSARPPSRTGQESISSTESQAEKRSSGSETESE